MNHINDEWCQFCGSTLYKRDAKPHCSGDNIKKTQIYFDSLIGLEVLDMKEYESKLLQLGSDEAVSDLFWDYKQARVFNPKAPLECLNDKTYKPFIPDNEKKIPMPLSYIPFPDLAEVYIAEIMLGRGLTNNEKDESRFIPKIDYTYNITDINNKRSLLNKPSYKVYPLNDKCSIYFAPLTWLVYPHSYISVKDMTEKTDYDEAPMERMFYIENIRGIFSVRDGNCIDDE